MARKKTPGLDVWLYGHRVAHLTEPSTYRYKLEFTEEALDVFGPGARVLSLALPFDTEAVADMKGAGPRPVAAFLEGLLPEGSFRRHLAASLGVTAIDTLALLRAVGAECAGAVQFVSEGETPSAGRVRQLAEDEVNRLVADLPNGRSNIDTVDEADLVAEARSWGLAPRIAHGTIRSVMAKVWDAAHSIALPPGAEQVADKLEALWVRRHWAVP